MVPVLETERLRLRGHRPDDLDACAVMWADPVVTRYIGGKPFTREEVWSRLLRYAGLWSWLGFGYWAAEEKATGQFTGELGFADFKRDIEPSTSGMPELGWVVAAHAHDKGYATEAVRAALAWGDAHLGSPQTVCLIHPENLASIRVAEKCGYRESGRAIYKLHSTKIFIRSSSVDGCLKIS
jgi:RimJ/RimL family protein N-acetyltransferase